MERFKPGAIDQLGGYPGRGIVVHRGIDDGWRWIYFVTGRSPSSRNRVLRWNATSLDVAPADETADHDELRHYECAVRVPSTGELVIGNGDHVARLAAALGDTTPLDVVLGTIGPEPDPPIHTPRLAAVLREGHAILTAVTAGPGASRRLTIPLPDHQRGAVVIHTYSGSIEQPAGTAPRFTLADAPADLPQQIWDALDPELRVLLATGSATSPEPDLVFTNRGDRAVTSDTPSVADSAEQ